MLRAWRFLLAVSLVSCLGCGNPAEKNKNKDLDRPQPERKQ
jgi:hypothetical protein